MSQEGPRSIIWRKGQVAGARQKKKNFLPNAIDGGSGSFTSMLDLNIMVNARQW